MAEEWLFVKPIQNTPEDIRDFLIGHIPTEYVSISSLPIHWKGYTFDQIIKCIEKFPNVFHTAEDMEQGKMVRKNTEENCNKLNESQLRVVGIVKSELRQFGCEDCHHRWWKHIEARNPVGFCSGCNKKYDPIPKDWEQGYGKFTCLCGNKWSSRHAILQFGQRCIKCGKFVKTLKVTEPPKDDGKKNVNRYDDPRFFKTNGHSASSCMEDNGISQNPHKCEGCATGECRRAMWSGSHFSIGTTLAISNVPTLNAPSSASNIASYTRYPQRNNASLSPYNPPHFPSNNLHTPCFSMHSTRSVPSESNSSAKSSESNSSGGSPSKSSNKFNSRLRSQDDPCFPMHSTCSIPSVSNSSGGSSSTPGKLFNPRYRSQNVSLGSCLPAHIMDTSSEHSESTKGFSGYESD